MKSMLRLLKWTVLVMAGIAGILALGAGILVASWHLQPDEALNQGAEKLLALDVAPPPERNAYFAILGLFSSPDLDPHIVGQKIAAEHARLVEAKEVDPYLQSTRASPLLGTTPLKFQHTKPVAFCSLGKDKCLAVFQGDGYKIEERLAKNSLLVERYRKIRTYPDFFEPIHFIDHSFAMELSTYVDASIAKRFAIPGARESALIELDAEIVSWRRISQKSTTDITYLVSHEVLYRKYRLVSEILAAYPAVVKQYPEIVKRITSPIPIEGTNLLPILKGAFRSDSLNFRFLDKNEDMELPPYYRQLIKLGGFRQNASINEMHLAYQEAIQFYAKAPEEILASKRGSLKHEVAADPFRIYVFAYNPVGKLINGEGVRDFRRYLTSLYDLAGYTRMLELQRRISEKNLQADAIASLLAASGTDLADPYTGKPMTWDGTTNKISFVGRGTRFSKDERLEVELSSGTGPR